MLVREPERSGTFRSPLASGRRARWSQRVALLGGGNFYRAWDPSAADPADAARFPERTVAWELNYRGDLAFLAQARDQADRGLAVHDGWAYFVHGWTRVIAEVFDTAIPASGPDFDAIARIAAAAGQG